MQKMSTVTAFEKTIRKSKFEPHPLRFKWRIE